MRVDLEEKEWSQVIAIIAQSHPLIAKISAQLVEQRPPNAVERQRQQPDTRAYPSREPSPFPPPNSGHSPQQRETGPEET